MIGAFSGSRAGRRLTRRHETPLVRWGYSSPLARQRVVNRRASASKAAPPNVVRDVFTARDEHQTSPDLTDNQSQRNAALQRLKRTVVLILLPLPIPSAKPRLSQASQAPHLRRQPSALIDRRKSRAWVTFFGGVVGRGDVGQAVRSLLRRSGLAARSKPEQIVG